MAEINLGFRLVIRVFNKLASEETELQSYFNNIDEGQEGFSYERVSKIIQRTTKLLSSFNNYFTKFSKGDYSFYQKKNNDVCDKFIKYIGCKTKNDYEKMAYDLNKDLEKDIISKFKISYPDHAANNTIDYSKFFVDRIELTELEFGINNEYDEVHIYCVTDSLFWARLNLPENKENIIKNSKYYRFILSSAHHDSNIKEVEKFLNDNPELEEHIKILKLYEKDPFKEIYIKKMMFPILSDIIIYSVRPKKSSNIIYKRCIMGTILKKNNDEAKYLPYEILSDEGNLILGWFNAVWDKYNEPNQ